MCDYNNKSNEKQRLKSKKQIQHGVITGSQSYRSLRAVIIWGVIYLPVWWLMLAVSWGASALTMCCAHLARFGLSLSSDLLLKVRALRETARQKTSCLFMSWCQKTHTVTSTTICHSNHRLPPRFKKNQIDTAFDMEWKGSERACGRGNIAVASFSKYNWLQRSWEGGGWVINYLLCLKVKILLRSCWCRENWWWVCWKQSKIKGLFTPGKTKTYMRRKGKHSTLHGSAYMIFILP